MNDNLVKNMEVAIAVIVTPHFLRALQFFPTPIADSLGVFIAFVAVYWLPPRGSVTFKKWVISGFLAALFVLIVSGFLNQFSKS